MILKNISFRTPSIENPAKYKYMVRNIYLWLANIFMVGRYFYGWLTFLWLAVMFMVGRYF